MQLKSLLLPLVILASGASIHASTTANVKTFGDRAPDRTLAARSTTNTGTTGTATRVVTTPAATSTSRAEDCCTCLTAAAGEGFACAAAILEGGCNIIADISCAIDYMAFAGAVPACKRCVGF